MISPRIFGHESVYRGSSYVRTTAGGLYAAGLFPKKHHRAPDFDHGAVRPTREGEGAHFHRCTAVQESFTSRDGVRQDVLAQRLSQGAVVVMPVVIAVVAVPQVVQALQIR